MRLVRARLRPYRLPLRNPLETAHGILRERNGCLLELETDSGLLGYGDACPFPGFRMETVEKAVETLDQVVRGLDKVDPRDLRSSLDLVVEQTAHAPASRFAIDCALHEIAALAENVHVSEYLASQWGVKATAGCSVNAFVGGSTLEELQENVVTAAGEGFSDLKLKLGARSWEEDLQRIRVVRDACGPEFKIRLDAGESWPEDEAARRLAQVADFDIDFIEQPLPFQNLEGMASLRIQAQKIGMMLAADESIVGVGDARRVIETGAADILVLKPAALGGLRAAAEVGALSQRAGLTCVVTTLIDSAWGTSASLALACALPGSRKSDGLATSSLLAADLAKAPRPHKGRLERFPGRGFGLELDLLALDRWALEPFREIQL